MTYTTGISGTQGVEITKADGTIDPNDSQKIVVNTNSATLNINGAGGVDKFEIEASSFTKSLTIAGNLGTVPDHQEVLGNYDTVRIDLSKTSGVNLDISKLLVSNPNDDGIQITASKGADNITLVAGANHDVIEFTAGGGNGAGANETYTVDFGNLRLYVGESITLDGVTLINTGSAALNSYAIADAFKKYVEGGYVTPTASTKILTNAAGTASVSGTAVTLHGKFESLDGDWAGATLDNGSSGAYKNALTFINATKADVKDLDMNWTANSLIRSAASGLPVVNVFETTHTSLLARTEHTRKDGTVSTGDPAGIPLGALPANTVHTIIYTNGDNKLELKVNATGAINDLDAFLTNVAIGGNAYTGATIAADAYMEFSLNGGAATRYNVNGDNKFAFSSADATAIKTMFDTLFSENFTLDVGVRNVGATTKVMFFRPDSNATSEATMTYQHFVQAGSTTTTAYDSTIKFYPAQEGSDGLIEVTFKGLLAGQSYSFNGKTVIATQDLSAEDVAYAFAYANAGANAGFVVASEFASSKVDETKVNIWADGAILTIQDQNTDRSDTSKNGIGASAENFVTGTNQLTFVDKAISTSTTQGQGINETFYADSYVVFSASSLGKAGSGDDAGVAANIKLVTSALDTITNFDIANDKLLLRKLDGSKYVANDRAPTAASNDSGIYVDTAGNKLSTSIANGIVDFSAGNAAADAITLDMKVYAAWSAVDANSGKVAGFEHGGDFYILATGGQDGISTDDLVIKLAGVTGITDIGAVLA